MPACGRCERGARSADLDLVPLEYSIEWLTCAFRQQARCDVMLVSLLGAALQEPRVPVSARNSKGPSWLPVPAAQRDAASWIP